MNVFQNTGSLNQGYGDPFFVEVPSTEKWSNTHVLFHPTGFIENEHRPLKFFFRIVTNIAGTGTIQLDGETMDALQYRRVPNSGFYYYEYHVENTTHSVTTTNPATRFYVSISTLTGFSRKQASS